MERINFENNVTKASAETFNTLQDNIEKELNKLSLSNLAVRFDAGFNASGVFYVRCYGSDDICYMLRATSTQIQYQMYNPSTEQWETIWTK